MVAIRVKTTLRRRGDLRGHVMKIDKALAGPRAVKVGLPAGKSDASVIQYAIWNHFGTAGSGQGFVTKGIGGATFGGFGGPIPPRPFLTVAMYRHRSELRADMRKIAESVVVNGKPLTPMLGLLGIKGAGFVQTTIASGVGPPNSPLTIKIKGSSKQLIAGGRMYSSITWAFDGIGA